MLKRKRKEDQNNNASASFKRQKQTKNSKFDNYCFVSKNFFKTNNSFAKPNNNVPTSTEGKWNNLAQIGFNPTQVEKIASQPNSDYLYRIISEHIVVLLANCSHEKITQLAVRHNGYENLKYLTELLKNKDELRLLEEPISPVSNNEECKVLTV